MSSRTQRGIALPRAEYASRNRLPMPRPTPMLSCEPWLALRASTRRTISTALGDRVFGLRPPGRVPARFNRLQPWGLHRREGATAHTAQKRLSRRHPGRKARRPPSGDFAGGFAPAGPVMAPPVLGPPKRGTTGRPRTPPREPPRVARGAGPLRRWG